MNKVYLFNERLGFRLFNLLNNILNKCDRPIYLTNYWVNKIVNLSK